MDRLKQTSDRTEGAGSAEGGIPLTLVLGSRSEHLACSSGLAGREKQLRERMWLLCEPLFCYRIKKKNVAKHTHVRT